MGGKVFFNIVGCFLLNIFDYLLVDNLMNIFDIRFFEFFFCLKKNEYKFLYYVSFYFFFYDKGCVLNVYYNLDIISNYFIEKI